MGSRTKEASLFIASQAPALHVLSFFVLQVKKEKVLLDPSGFLEFYCNDLSLI